MSETADTREKLRSTIEKVQRSIKQVRDRNEHIGEAQTKTSLIEPVLHALGWDTTDLDEVSLEYKHKQKDNPVDYALFVRRSACLFVEAKALDTNLDDHKWKSQVVGYANAAGVEWCVLTDGDWYCIYNSHAPVDVEQKLFRSIRVSDTAQAQFALDTLGLLSKGKLSDNILRDLWKAHFVDRNVRFALKAIIAEQDSGLVRLVRKRTAELTPSEIKESIRRAHIAIDYPESPLPAEEPTSTPQSAVEEEGETGQAEGAPVAPTPTQHRRRRSGGSQSFKWLLTMQADGTFDLLCRYLPDETKSFRVTGRQAPVSDDFKPARKQLLLDICEMIRPLFPSLPENLVRAKAWSGVHKVYTASEYGK